MIFNKRKAVQPRIPDSPPPQAEAERVDEPSYIGPDTLLEGNISSRGEVHVEGEVRGSIEAATCLIDMGGRVMGAVSAKYVVVRGRVVGPITAGQVTIQKGAHVEGNVVHQGLSIEHGAFVMGSVTQSMAGGELADPNGFDEMGNNPLLTFGRDVPESDTE